MSQPQPVLDGMIFFATMRLRTPLRVLCRHGEVFRGEGEPPKIIEALWEGIWVPQTRTFASLGIDIPEFRPSVASDIGLVKVDEYMPFLLAMRRACEQDAPMMVRRQAVLTECSEVRWLPYVQRHGSAGDVLARLQMR